MFLCKWLGAPQKYFIKVNRMGPCSQKSILCDSCLASSRCPGMITYFTPCVFCCIPKSQSSPPKMANMPVLFYFY